MNSIVKFLKAMGYPYEKKGVCRGLALMAERARKYGQYDKFIARLDLLTRLDKEGADLPLLIHRAQHTPKEALTSDDEILLTIHAFFSQVSLYHMPQEIKKFLGATGPHLTQTEFKMAEELIYQDEPLSVPTNYFLSMDADNETGLENFKVFFETIQKSGEPVGLVVNSDDHSIHLFYEKGVWRLVNHSNHMTFSCIEELLSTLPPSLRTIFMKNGNNIANLFFEVFDNGPSSQQLLTNLKAISDTSLKLLGESKSINHANHNHTTALHLAAQNGDLGAVNYLLKKGASAEQTNRYGDTPLFVAAYNGHTEVVKALLKKMPRVVNQANTKDHFTPLMTAAYYGYVDVVNVLLEHGASLDEHYNKKAPLLIAAEQGHIEVIKAIINTKNVSAITARLNGLNWLELAAVNGRVNVINAFSEEIIKFGATNRLLDLAIKENQLGVVNALLSKTALKDLASERAGNIWNTTKTILAQMTTKEKIRKNEEVARLIKYVDSKNLSGHDKDKKTFFIEIGLLIANKQFTLEALISKLEQYKDTKLFYQSWGSHPENSGSAKLIQSLFIRINRPITPNHLKAIANGEIGQIKNQLMQSRRGGVFTSPADKKKDETQFQSSSLKDNTFEKKT